jgi:hypothetical protein
MAAVSGCDVVVGAMRDAGSDGSSQSDAGCPAAPACNWCNGTEKKDSKGCVVGYICKNGADPCTTQPCSQGGCKQNEQCRSDELCWPTNCVPQAEVCNGMDDDCNGIVDDGAVCPAGQICTNGACVSGCAPGLTPCNGACVDLDTNTSNCGSCGIQCASGQVCVSGVCSPVPCTADSDCAPGSKCVGGSCRTSCTNDADCLGAMICVNGICQ